MFSACPMESGGGGDDGVDVPKVGDLPALPAGKTPVANNTDAIALLNALKASGLRGDIEDQVEEEKDERTEEKITSTGWSESWNFKDVENDGLKISSSGSESEGGVDFEAEGYVPKEGDSYKSSSHQEVKVELLADKPKGQFALVKGSTIAEKQEGGDEVKIKKVTTTGGTITGVTVTYSFSYGGAYGYGLTAVNDSMAGKLFLMSPATEPLP
jgi:hypothetical protein